jgi:hypothetical protein
VTTGFAHDLGIEIAGCTPAAYDSCMPSRTCTKMPEDLRARAAVLGVHIEFVSLIIASMPQSQVGRHEGLLVLDQAREVLRSMYPDALSPKTRAILTGSLMPIGQIN